MRVLVCGSRHFLDYTKLEEVLDYYHEQYVFTTVISGMAKGADTLAVGWADLRAIRVEEFPADWNTHGKRAGPIRNTQMLKEGKPDLVIAFLAPDSRGTKNMIEQARSAGVPVKVINI